LLEALRRRGWLVGQQGRVGSRRRAGRAS
jgi:hypothetical protein